MDKPAASNGREKISLERVERERLVSPTDDRDSASEVTLRPSKINEFIGQEDLKANLGIALQAAKKRKEPLEHLLLSGPPGLGKTTLAHIVAHEMGVDIRITSGPAIERTGDLVGILTNLENGDILFIDEIHRLSKTVEEFLYPAMEDYRIDVVKGAGAFASTYKMSLKRFTLIGATTRQGLLSSPLRDRFGVAFHLDFYEPADLTKIVERSAGLLGVTLEADASAELARRARGTPRIANKLLRRVRDYAQVKGHDKIGSATVAKALEGHGIDTNGLDSLDRKVLKVLIEMYGGGPVGIESLSATLNEEVDTLVDVVEPFLLKIGFLRRTARGREVTRAAYEHLKISPDSKSPDFFRR